MSSERGNQSAPRSWPDNPVPNVRNGHPAAAMDAELSEALAARNERRRALLGVLVDRQGIAEGQAKADIVDLLFTLTSFATFTTLRGEQRDGEAVCALLLPLCDQIFSGEPKSISPAAT